LPVSADAAGSADFVDVADLAPAADLVDLVVSADLAAAAGLVDLAPAADLVVLVDFALAADFVVLVDLDDFTVLTDLAGLALSAGSSDVAASAAGPSAPTSASRPTALAASESSPERRPDGSLLVSSGFVAADFTVLTDFDDFTVLTDLDDFTVLTDFGGLTGFSPPAGFRSAESSEPGSRAFGVSSSPQMSSDVVGSGTRRFGGSGASSSPRSSQLVRSDIRRSLP
jgi:hypothetical protein